MAVVEFNVRHPRLALPKGALGFCIPCGIGDASWLYAKVKHLPALLGREVFFSMPDSEPRRGHQLIELLPDVRWAGYEPGWKHSDIFAAALSHEAKPDDLIPGKWHALEVNRWLERGNLLKDFWPWCPIDYHYPIPLPKTCTARALELMEGLPARKIAVYVSNRDKDKYPGWALWSAEKWVSVLVGLQHIYGKDTGFVFLGAEYDRDKTLDIASKSAQYGLKTRLCLAESLGTALACLRAATLCIAYPSGIGILANVLGVPAIMLLPDCLHRMAGTYADPADIAAGRYHTPVAPATEQVLQLVQAMMDSTRLR